MKQLLTSPIVLVRGAMAAALASDTDTSDQAPLKRQRSATIAKEPSHCELRRTTLKSDVEIDTVRVGITWKDLASLVALSLFMLGVVAVSNLGAEMIMAARLQP